MQGRQKTPEDIAAELAANAEHNRQQLLFKTDKHIRKQIVYRHFTVDTLGLFALTCQQAEEETALLRITTAAIHAEPMSYKQADKSSLAAIAMLKRHPELLFVKSLVIDHVGREIFASPYQLFLGAGDVWAVKQVHDDILPHITDGEALADAQFQEQFPHCKLPFDPAIGEEALYDDRNREQIAQVIEHLKNIIAAISVDRCTDGEATLDKTRNAVAELCQLFAPKQGQIIATGLHFPLKILAAIISVYDILLYRWSNDQVSFFAREVLGAALAASTTVDGQCYKHGLSTMYANKGPDRRDGLFCSHPVGIPPELAPIADKLGRTMFVDPFDGQSCFQSSSEGYFDWYHKNGDRLRRTIRLAVAAYWSIGALMRSKNLMRAELKRTCREEKTPRCVIC